MASERRRRRDTQMSSLRSGGFHRSVRHALCGLRRAKEVTTALRYVKRIAKWAIAVLAIALVVIQFVPVDRTNPPVETEVPATAEVREVLRRACYDCHSNETVWPWYSRIAPVSWLAVRDVREARAEMNFSTWNRLTTKDQIEALHESWEEVEEEEMPLWFYLPLHPEARLSEQDRSVLQAWSLSMVSAEREEQ